MVKVLSKTLKWPLISLFITASFHFASVAIWPEIRNLFIAPTLAPMVLAYGIWVGYTAIRKGGNYFTSIIAALILGILPLLIETFCFGMILHLEGRALVGLFALSMILFGSLIGGGFALSNK
ncbi:MAG: hypothetical protein WCE64_12840 [Bacteroidales bacterium]